MLSSCLPRSTDEGNEIYNKVLVSPRSYTVQCISINHYTIVVNHFIRELLQRSRSTLYGCSVNLDQFFNILIMRKYVNEIKLLLKMKT